MIDKELLEQISKKLSVLIALILVSEPEKRTLSEKVELFSRLKLSNNEIAEILGTTKGTIEVVKSRITKNKKQK